MGFHCSLLTLSYFSSLSSAHSRHRLWTKRTHIRRGRALFKRCMHIDVPWVNERRWQVVGEPNMCVEVSAGFVNCCVDIIFTSGGRQHKRDVCYSCVRYVIGRKPCRSVTWRGIVQPANWEGATLVARGNNPAPIQSPGLRSLIF